MNSSFEIQVLVNGHKCKQYPHHGKVYIEAKHNSEYELEIKNNTCGRILCLASVDGLNVLTGQTASEEDAGYVINSYSPLKIKGFRYSDDEVGAFKFTTKRNSYAHSVGSCEAAKNCGVIGFQLYYEYLDLYITPTTILWGGCSSQLYGNSNYLYDSPIVRSSADGRMDFDCYNQPKTQNLKCSNTIKTCNFDMGSTWGQKKESKIIETEFKKGVLAYSLDIYYASRQALIDMGVPISVGHQVSFPKSFPNKYATPPSGWRG